jgi:hypothetical protein
MTLSFPYREFVENDGPNVVVMSAECNCDGGSEEFHVYHVAGSNHFHIECVNCETSYCPYNSCATGPDTTRDPVHVENEAWYHWDETWTKRAGPFPTRDAAEENLAAYVHWLNGGRQT